MRENRTNTGRPSWRARPRESEGREQEPGRHAASPAEGKDHGAGVEAEGEMWQGAGCSSGRGTRHGERRQGKGSLTDGRGRGLLGRAAKGSARAGPEGRVSGGGARRVSHLYCLKSWSDSLKPLLSSMLMPARASSASCRGAAAESPSSRRRGRCCSEPAMGARGSAQGRGEVG